MKKYKNVVWDWNGTLLNDVNTGWKTLNSMLGKRGLPVLTLEKYRDTFGFPVETFYQTIGFDLQKESLHELSVDFVETYDLFAGEVSLNEGVREVMEEIRRRNIRQYILSALREDLLCQITAAFGIDVFFEKMCGSDNIYAAGKVERGRRMVEMLGILPEETLMVGDTVHDAEVARELGFGILLYEGGHNTFRRLQEKAPVITHIEDILAYLPKS